MGTRDGYALSALGRPSSETCFLPPSSSMARDPFLLDSTRPTAIAPATPTIAHVQLRDLLICPREQGLLNYVVHHGIVEQDINSPKSPPRTLASLSFTPISLTSLQLGPGTLVAAGGQEAEIYLSYHSSASSSSVAGTEERRRSRTRVHWEYDARLDGSINNSVLLTSLSLTRSNESSVEPRVGISNNDGTVRLYDVPLNVPKSRRCLHEVGQVRLDVPVNHSSISPDGRTLLSVGDSSKIYFHQITGGSNISFQPITTLNIPPPDTSSSFYSSPSSRAPYSSSSYTSLAASFSTAFSGDGSKFAVASQEGVVAVWDVRSTKPMRVFHTNKMRGGLGNGSGNGGATGWLSDDPWEWTRGTKAPGWCVRNVKFNGGEGSRLGKEVMAFTEHTSFIHIVDARTFETCDSVNVPALPLVGGQHKRSSTPRREPTSNGNPTLRALAARFREARRMAGVSIEQFPLSRAELLESLRDGENTRRNTAELSTNAQDGNTLLRRLPVSNARERRYSPTPITTRRRRALDRSVTSPAMTSPASPASDTPAGISERLSPASAAHLAMSAAARDMQARESAALASSSSPSLLTSASAAGTATPRAGGMGTPGIVQALGDAFRIPLPVSVGSRSNSNGIGVGRSGSGYSAPAIIGDSTWRTLSGTHAVGASLARVASAGASSAPAGPVGSSTSVEDDSRRDYRWNTILRVWERDQESGTATATAPVDDDESGQGEGIVVVPDLGDRDVESEVHALLAVHGIQSRLGSQADLERTASRDTETSAGAETALEYEAYLRTVGEGNNAGDENEGGNHRGAEDEDYHTWFLRALGALGDGSAAFDDAIGAARRLYEEHADRQTRVDDDMDDDEEDEEDDRMIIEGEEERHDDEYDDEQDEDDDAESECASRSGSPFAGSYSSHTNHRTFPFSSISSAPWSARRYGSYARTSPSAHSVGQRPSHSVGSFKYFEDLDIAGLCFDPWGEKMYAAGVGMGPDFSFDTDSGNGAGSVVEWTVRGADKRWWVDEGWM